MPETEQKQIREHNKTVTKLLLERNSQIAEANKILAEFPAKFPLNDTKDGIEIWHFKDLTDIIKRTREVLK